MAFSLVEKSMIEGSRLSHNLTQSTRLQQRYGKGTVLLGWSWNRAFDFTTNMVAYSLLTRIQQINESFFCYSKENMNEQNINFVSISGPQLRFGLLGKHQHWTFFLKKKKKSVAQLSIPHGSDSAQ